MPTDDKTPANAPRAIDALIVAVPETSGSALYGMVDVLASTGNLWQQLVGTEPEMNLIRPQIVSPKAGRFRCGNGIPVEPDTTIAKAPPADIIILPELWLAPDEHLNGRYPELMTWIREAYDAGACVYSACSGIDHAGRIGPARWARGDIALGLRRSVPHLLSGGEIRPRIEPDHRGPHRPPGHRGRHDVLARPGDPHHCAPLQPGRGAAHLQSLSAQVAQRRAVAVHDARPGGAARRLGSARMPNLAGGAFPGCGPRWHAR